MRRPYNMEYNDGILVNMSWCHTPVNVNNGRQHKKTFSGDLAVNAREMRYHYVAPLRSWIHYLNRVH